MCGIAMASPVMILGIDLRAALLVSHQQDEDHQGAFGIRASSEVGQVQRKEFRPRKAANNAQAPYAKIAIQVILPHSQHSSG